MQRDMQRQPPKPATTPNTERLRPTLTTGAQALGWALAPEQEAALLRYLALLGRWNQVYNLTAVRDPAEMLTHHLLDCLAVVRPLRGFLAERPAPRLLDVGSGGGLPGIVLALLCPEVDVTCVDTVGKKAAFIRQAGAELRLANLTAVHARVETLPPAPGYDLVTARAFSSLALLEQLTHPLLRANGVWAAMKGQRPDEEMNELPGRAKVFHVEQLTVPGLDADRCIVWFRPTNDAV